MRKARILLATIAVLAVSGGIVAFKTSKTFGSVIYTTGSPNVPATNTLSGWTITFPDFPGAVPVYATDVYNTPGALTYITQRN